MLSGAPFAPSLPPGTFGALALVRQANTVGLALLAWTSPRV
jgi:hypothetical protein